MAEEFNTPYTPAGAPPPRRSNTTLIIVIVVVVLLLCCCCGLAGFMWQWGGDALLSDYYSVVPQLLNGVS